MPTLLVDVLEFDYRHIVVAANLVDRLVDVVIQFGNVLLKKSDISAMTSFNKQTVNKLKAGRYMSLLEKRKPICQPKG